MSDRERYTADELARLSDAELVRRELDRRNRRSLAVLLVTFAIIGVVSLHGDAIVRDVARFRGRAQDDDVTVVVARVVPRDTIGAAWT